ncbi:CDGSH iron-sulfur domain-containing protein [Brevibacterium aurantiacum]|uniref:CDGSH iron-sulfur domain-containing protein n=1 Tax=Brevibacterium aurantiacum TaxID=273384 RepID=A0A556C3U3_BREAU|nr:CDGSH iron-sulfur domain-containing protein [Brevibacterium aurantiacum]
MKNDNTSPVTVTACPDGPLLVRGDFSLAEAPGRTPERPDRKVVALCRCGKTGIAPLCDGSHKLTGFRAPSPPITP